MLRTCLKRASIFSAVLAGLLLYFSCPLAAQSRIPSDEVTRESLKFARVYGMIQQNYMQALEPDRVILEGGVRGMLATLDPFSSFFDQGQFKMLQEETRGEALGFGSILYVQPGKITIIQTQQGSPSWRAGLGPGDQVVAVNGISIERLGLRQLIQLLQKAKSHPVHLGVIRPGEAAPADITMKPAEVNLPTVDTSFLGPDGIGYIHVASFESKTPQEIMTALSKMGVRNLKGLILDLRNNPGGVLASAVEVGSLFLNPGVVVLTVQGRAVARKTYKTERLPLKLDTPLIVLVNGSTASAAEVVTAALQDHDRALVVGEPTFGKGVVENVMPLSGDMGLALLTAEYFTPSGRSIQKPLPGTALQNPSLGIRGARFDPHTQGAPEFHTDDGRPVLADGGIAPDIRVPDWKMDPWLTFLNQTGMFTSFASEYVSRHHPVAKTFVPDATTLESFRDFLAGQRIRSPRKYWSRDEPYVKARVRTEIFNLVFGLDFGNEVAAQRDPQVEKAVSLFPDVAKLLRNSRFGIRHSGIGARHSIREQ